MSSHMEFQLYAFVYKFTVTEGFAVHYWAWQHFSTPSLQNITWR